MKANVEKVTAKTPPRTHDLQWLVKLAKLSPDESDENFLAEINAASVATRYPEDLKRMRKDFSEKRAKIWRPMEILGYTQEEYRAGKRGSFIGDEVKPKGIEIT